MPLVKGEVATTIHQKLIPSGSGETLKVVTSFWRKEKCYCINIAAPRTRGIDIQSVSRVTICRLQQQQDK